ncbi:MAG: ACT domain protein [Candidatus Methanoplasma sp.]|jgi:ACT domain-containing protein|nr:ACT domain protein [Candidatus Methanoplasma sp.]
MRSWEFTRVEGNKIRIDGWLAGVMGLVEGGYIYSSLFRYPEKGPKRYELLLSMYPQDNFRTLSHMVVYMEDVPGATVQSAEFLAGQGVNILNSVSLNGISDTTIIWNIMGEISFAGEGEIIKERFARLKAQGDPSVSLIKHVSIKPASVGRIFRRDSDGVKEEVRHGSPITLEDGAFDLCREYGDVLSDVDGTEVMITLDPASWLVSVVFFKQDTELVQINMSIPDSPGAIGAALSCLAEADVNLISVFSKIAIAYQKMSLEVVADIKSSGLSDAGLAERLRSHLSEQNGVFELSDLKRLN